MFILCICIPINQSRQFLSKKKRESVNIQLNRSHGSLFCHQVHVEARKWLFRGDALGAGAGAGAGIHVFNVSLLQAKPIYSKSILLIRHTCRYISSLPLFNNSILSLLFYIYNPLIATFPTGPSFLLILLTPHLPPRQAFTEAMTS